MKPILVALFVSGLCSSAAAAGLGEPCEANADCGEGLECEVIGGTTCACASDPDGGDASCEPCEPSEEKACVPGPCSDDADCGDGFVCATYEVGCASATPDCAPDSSCEPVEPEPCEEESVSVCAPRWVLPCEDDAACGEGFTCVAEELCSCSGGGTDTPGVPYDGGDPGSDGSDDREEFAPPPEEDCECEPSDTKWCRPNAIECQTADQCPDGWSCVSGDDVDVPCAMPEDGSEPNCMAPEQEEPRPSFCAPPGGGYGGDSRDVGEDLGIPTNAEFDDGSASPEDPNVPQGGSNQPSSGCNAAGGSLLLALIGLMLALRRRVA